MLCSQPAAFIFIKYNYSMNFLDQIFLDNSIRSYLFTAGAVLVVFILKRVLSKSVAILISRLIDHRKMAFNKQRFHALVLSPIELFLVLLSILISFSSLKFPSALNFHIYKTNLHDVLETVARGVIIGTFIWLCTRLIVYIGDLLHEKASFTDDRTDDQLIIFFRDFLKALMWIVGVLMILKFCFGFALSNVLTALSIVGAALALAFKESVENLIASFIIFFDKPFTIGDLVKVESVTGNVEKIGLRSTRLRTNDKTYVTVPNKKMVDSILDNQSLRTQRNVLSKLELDVNVTATKLKDLIESIEEMLGKEPVSDSNVFLSDTGINAHILHIEYFVSVEISVKEFFKLREAINLSFIQMLNEKGIPLAASAADVIIHQAPGTKITLQ